MDILDEENGQIYIELNQYQKRSIETSREEIAKGNSKTNEQVMCEIRQ